MRVELDRPLEIRDRGVAIVGVDRAENKPSKIVAAAEVLFPSLGVFGRPLAEFFGLEIGELEPQALEDPLGDAVLQGENVAALGVDAVAPENVARHDVEQLSGDAQLFAGTQETRPTGRRAHAVPCPPRAGRPLCRDILRSPS